LGQDRHKKKGVKSKSRVRFAEKKSFYFAASTIVIINLQDHGSTDPLFTYFADFNGLLHWGQNGKMNHPNY